MSSQVDRTKDILFKVLVDKFSLPSNLAEVRKGRFQHTKAILGKKLSLRTSHELQNGLAINLVSFDPNFKIREVICRSKGCSKKNPDPAVEERFGFGKRDLYLCLQHRDKLKDSLKEMCQKQEVDSLTPRYGSEDLSGYTSLIPLLEKIYCEAVKGRILKGTPKIAQEAILNVRNFLLITNAVLNPDPDNEVVVLPPVLQILQEIIENREATENLVYLLREVTEVILFSFGVMYNWVRLGISNPGGKIGAGIGGLVGMVGGGWFGGPFGAAGAGVGGATFGGMIGSGIYDLFAATPPNRGHEHGIMFHGNPEGDLNMVINDYQEFVIPHAL